MCVCVCVGANVVVCVHMLVCVFRVCGVVSLSLSLSPLLKSFLIHTRVLRTPSGAFPEALGSAFQPLFTWPCHWNHHMESKPCSVMVTNQASISITELSFTQTQNKTPLQVCKVSREGVSYGSVCVPRTFVAMFTW